MPTQNEEGVREDRRIQRTRRMLNEAMLALVVEKPWDAMSIRDITERADVNRATFYHHYATKDELLAAALEAQFEALVASFESLPDGAHAFSDPEHLDYATDVLLFRHVQEHAALYRVLLGEQGMGQVTFRITESVAGICQRLIHAWMDTSDLGYPVEVVAHHMAGSIIGLVRWWLINDMPFTPEEMGRMSHALCVYGVQQAGSLGSGAREKASKEPA
jgi:AcrR family transcriptional regulator